MIGYAGATSLSEALKSNATLTELDLSGENKKKEDTQKTFINNSLFSILFTQTGNDIEDTGATSLSEALKSNTTLKKLYLKCEDQRKRINTQRASINKSHLSLFYHINRQRDWRDGSNIIE